MMSEPQTSIGTSSPPQRDGRVLRVFAYLMVIGTLLVILAGGVVRATQSGMGCPDWPKCFGLLVPPTSESQLPANYQEIYAHRGYATERFDPVKTWIEYVNRLLGALLGVFIAGFTVAAGVKLRENLIRFIGALVLLVLTGFQAWMGSVVVASNLEPVKITIHMVVAMVILCLTIWLLVLSYGNRSGLTISADPATRRRLWFIVLGALILSFAQLVLGTQVREEIDMIAKAMNFENREFWIANLGDTFKVHRSLSIAVLLLNLSIWIQGSKASKVRRDVLWLRLPMVLVCIEALLGIILSYLSVPAFAQPLHLLGASGIIAAQFILLLKLGR